MKVVLFCGGRGMRMREFSENIPKPMVPVGPRPILWHLMRYYAHYGHTDFVICLGYKGDHIKRYFLDYEEWLSNDFVLRGGNGSGDVAVEMLNTDLDNWNITFVDTGLDANIGQRLVAVREHLAGEEMFLANYGDGLSDCPIDVMVDEVAADPEIIGNFLCVPPSQSFHVVEIDVDNRATDFAEADSADVWVNGGYFVFRQELFDYIRPGEELVYEPFRRLMDERRLLAHRHESFWMGMDTFKDRQELDDMHQAGAAPWEKWI
ncbi:MAG: glucose-1-phosphate cytidylyltransferase [Acidimicrobiales bacterium]|nr:MAG: glucose-1-phosphate cytidylyltransferase [Acidimicrobiales bacterium]